MQTATTIKKGSQRNVGISTMSEAVRSVFDNTDLLLECLSFIGWDRRDFLLWVRTCSGWRRCIFAAKSPIWKHLTAWFDFRKLDLRHDSRLFCKRFTFAYIFGSSSSFDKLAALTNLVSQIRAFSTTALFRVIPKEKTSGQQTNGQNREEVEWVVGGVKSVSDSEEEAKSGDPIMKRKAIEEERKEQNDQRGARVEIDFLRLVNVDAEIAAYLLEQFQVKYKIELMGNRSRWRRCRSPKNLPAFLSTVHPEPLFQADGGAHIEELRFCGTGLAFPEESDAVIFQDISLPPTLKALKIGNFKVGDGHGLAQAVSNLNNLRHVSISNWPLLRATSLSTLTRLTRLHLHQIAMGPEEVQALLDQLNLLQDLEIGNSVPEHSHPLWCGNGGFLDPVRLSFQSLHFLQRLVLKFCCFSAVSVEMDLPPQLESYNFHPGVTTETNSAISRQCPFTSFSAGTRIRRPTGGPVSTFRVLWKVDLSWRCCSALCWTCCNRRESARRSFGRLGRLTIRGAEVPPDFRQFVGPGQFIYNATV